jgi:preprotein translocase subunit SecF
MYRIIQKRNYLFGLSLALLIPGIVGFSIWGLRLGIDFTGGSLVRLNFSNAPLATNIVQDAASQAGMKATTVQETGAHGLTVRTEAMSNDQRTNFLEKLQAKDPTTVQESFESIGPTIGNELKRKAITATAIVLLIIVLYITWAFRRVSSGPVPSWVYGVCAIIALVHDLFMVVGVFAIFGHFFGIEIDALFVTALLTVLGFSVHDTIVVYDRIRERLIGAAGKTFEDVVNESLNQTMIRSINTSMTALLILSALFFFGGETIRNFVLALLIGIASGTYSSIFVASPLLVIWHNWKLKKRAA